MRSLKIILVLSAFAMTSLSYSQAKDATLAVKRTINVYQGKDQDGQNCLLEVLELNNDAFGFTTSANVNGISQSDFISLDKGISITEESETITSRVSIKNLNSINSATDIVTNSGEIISLGDKGTFQQELVLNGLRPYDSFKFSSSVIIRGKIIDRSYECQSLVRQSSRRSN